LSNQLQEFDNLILIIGGARSGKSQLAESLASQSQKSVHYLATMPWLAGDEEQEARIGRHRSRRPSHWQTIECPNNLAEAIAALPKSGGTCLIDCLSLFISNVLLQELGESADNPYTAEDSVMTRVEAVLRAIRARSEYEFFVVTNETGWGVVPETALGRAFRDFLGLANQRFARQSHTVWLTCAGLPLQLKPPKL
jgi:adenosylcobinamide kinase/adenosylcobinamide-phosphate guanylyltransferase